MFRRQSVHEKIRSCIIAANCNEPGFLFPQRIGQTNLVDFPRCEWMLDGCPQQKVLQPLANDKIRRQPGVVNRQEVINIVVGFAIRFGPNLQRKVAN